MGGGGAGKMAKGVTAAQAWSPTQRWKEKKNQLLKGTPFFWHGHANTHTPTGENKTERGKKSENSLYCINSVHSLDLKQAVTGSELFTEGCS